MHRYWQCCKNNDLDFEDSNGLRRTAQETPQLQALWTRGVLRQDFMERLVNEYSPEPVAVTWWEKEPRRILSHCTSGADPAYFYRCLGRQSNKQPATPESRLGIRCSSN